ncbi:unnamed protein product [Miscanthus lutarioriparius]|uniref:NAC domain-containing protein n=1 Tax=Miscanthus lutarioriparius TaxID=422564 RepID=A0A811SRC7_9POAL|nr:unnamed protein product [Miscanthus lutarioriparius]CAD6343677.1 unnamed protein product [Miscanthus lutarioriparius]
MPCLVTSSFNPSSNQDRSPTDNKASIALLRRLRAGGDDVQFFHHVDVCAAPPEVFVADLEPVPGTGLEDDGYSRIWYLYHAKKFTNTRGKLSGYRQRAVTGGGGTSWHSEISRRDVQGSGGGTFCTFSYGRKTEPSARSIDRMGWCMVEYDFVAADKKQDEAAADSSNYYQPQADVQEVAVQQPAGPGGDFNFNIEEISFYVDDECMLRADESEQGRRGLQQPISEPKQHDVEFIRLPCGPVVPVVAEATV